MRLIAFSDDHAEAFAQHGEAREACLDRMTGYAHIDRDAMRVAWEAGFDEAVKIAADYQVQVGVLRSKIDAITVCIAECVVNTASPSETLLKIGGIVGEARQRLSDGAKLADSGKDGTR